MPYIYHAGYLADGAYGPPVQLCILPTTPFQIVGDVRSPTSNFALEAKSSVEVGVEGAHMHWVQTASCYSEPPRTDSACGCFMKLIWKRAIVDETARETVLRYSLAPNHDYARGLAPRGYTLRRSSSSARSGTQIQCPLQVHDAQRRQAGAAMA